MRGGRVGSLAASPTLVGAVTVLVVDGRCLPRLQGEPGPALRPHLQALGRAPQRQHPGPGQRGADRRRPGRPDQRRSSRSRATTTGSVSAKVDMELNQDLDPLPEDSTVIVRSRSALGPQVPGDPARRLRPGLRARGDDAALRRPRPSRSRSTRSSTPSTSPTRAAIQANLLEFGNALAGPRRQPERRDRRAAPAGRAARAGDAEPRLARHRTSPASSRRSRRPPPRSLRSPRCRASSSSTSRPPSAPSPTSRAPSSRRRSPGRPRPRTPRSTRCPRIRPFLANTAGLFGDLRPGLRARCAPVSERRRARRSSLGIKALRISPAFNAQLDPTAQALLDLNNDAGVARGHRRPRPPSTTCSHPPLAFITPGPVGLQLRHARSSGTSPSMLSLRRRHRDLPARSSSCSAADRARTARAAPAPRPPTAAATTRQLPPLQPLPEHGLARADARVRGRQRGLHRRAGGDRQRARQPGNPSPRARSSAQTQKAKKKKKKKKK